LLEPSAIVGEVSIAAKFTPSRVMLFLTDVGPLYMLSRDTTGESYEKKDPRVPTNETRVIAAWMVPPWPFGVWQSVDVVVSHVVVKHNVLPTRTVGVRLSGAKLLPDRVMDEPDEVGPLISIA
jgi:hypothetical protein